MTGHPIYSEDDRLESSATLIVCHPAMRDDSFFPND
jgi:hypothetical protein